VQRGVGARFGGLTDCPLGRWNRAVVRGSVWPGALARMPDRVRPGTGRPFKPLVG
jgi:hypothetical protein